MKQILIAGLGGLSLVCSTVLLCLGQGEVEVAIVAGLTIQIANMIITSSVEKKVNGHMTALIDRIPSQIAPQETPDVSEQEGD